jgi:hypothetical protein
MVRHGACGDEDAPTEKTNVATENHMASSKTVKSEAEFMNNLYVHLPCVSVLLDPIW